MFLKSIQIKFLFYAFLLLLPFGSIADTKIQTVDDLRELKQLSKDTNLPVLILFTADDCDYCEAIRENYLLPMIKSGDYTSKILFRQIYIEDYNYLRNEKGELVGGDQIALQHDIDVTPTIIFVNADWKELTRRIVGLNPAYFGQRLNSSISQAVNFQAVKK